jgi:hypothetical protein
MLPIRSRPWLKPYFNRCPFRIKEHELLELMLLRESDIERIWGRLRKRKIKHAKPVAAVAMA